MADRGPQPTESMIEQIVLLINSALSIHGTKVNPDTSLLDAAGFDSIVIVELCEKLETSFAIELDPGLITPETFQTPRHIAQAVVMSTNATRT